MRHARQITDITATVSNRKWDSSDKNKRQTSVKTWAKADAKSKKSGILTKRNMATTLSNNITVQERCPQVEVDSEITRLREEIDQEKQMK